MFWLNKTEIWIMVWNAICRIIRRLNAICKFCRCFDTLSLWRLLHGKMWGVLKLWFVTKTFATKGVLFGFCAGSLFIQALFRFRFEKYVREMDADDRKRYLACAYLVCCTSFVITSSAPLINVPRRVRQTRRYLSPAARSVTQVTAALTIHDLTVNKTRFPLTSRTW